MKLNNRLVPDKWNLSYNQLVEIYELEKKLALRLKASNFEERQSLYREVYQEYFDKLPFHPQFTVKQSEKMSGERIKYQIQYIQSFLDSKSIFAEIGAGDCLLSLEVAKLVKKVYAIDVAENISQNSSIPSNFQLIISGGINLSIPEKIDVAFSNQLMEHLHPEDAEYQLREIYSSLNNNGIYICITPNKLIGPNDISRFFSNNLECFHLKEYCFTDLYKIFKIVGFRSVKGILVLKNKAIFIPSSLIMIFEYFFNLISLKNRLRLYNSFRVIRLFISIPIFGVK